MSRLALKAIFKRRIGTVYFYFEFTKLRHVKTCLGWDCFLQINEAIGEEFLLLGDFKDKNFIFEFFGGRGEI